MNTRQLDKMPKSRSILNFFLVAIAFYIPFIVFARVEVLPSVSLLNFAAFIPMTAALILVYRENKIAGVKELLKRCFDYHHFCYLVYRCPGRRIGLDGIRL